MIDYIFRVNRSWNFVKPMPKNSRRRTQKHWDFLRYDINDFRSCAPSGRAVETDWRSNFPHYVPEVAKMGMLILYVTETKQFLYEISSRLLGQGMKHRLNFWCRR